jgi:O-antigen ligase
MWQEMTSYIYDSPIIGYGIDSYKTLREKQIKDVYESTYAHNDYFRLLIELGIIGLLLYLNLIIQTLRSIYKKFLQSKNYKYLISFVGILIIFLISSVDNMLDTTSLLWIMWVYIAYLVSD